MTRLFRTLQDAHLSGPSPLGYPHGYEVLRVAGAAHVQETNDSRPRRWECVVRLEESIGNVPPGYAVHVSAIVRNPKGRVSPPGPYFVRWQGDGPQDKVRLEVGGLRTHFPRSSVWWHDATDNLAGSLAGQTVVLKGRCSSCDPYEDLTFDSVAIMVARRTPVSPSVVVGRILPLLARSRLNQRDLDVVEDPVKLNLLDPLSYRRITHAARGRSCFHVDCFDLETFLTQMQERGHATCPFCQLGPILPAHLVIDTGFQEALDRAAKDATVACVPLRLYYEHEPEAAAAAQYSVPATPPRALPPSRPPPSEPPSAKRQRTNAPAPLPLRRGRSNDPTVPAAPLRERPANGQGLGSIPSIAETDKHTLWRHGAAKLSATLWGTTEIPVSRWWKGHYDAFERELRATAELQARSKGVALRSLKNIRWMNKGRLTEAWFGLCNATQSVAHLLSVDRGVALNSQYGVITQRAVVPPEALPRHKVQQKLKDFMTGGAYKGTRAGYKRTDGADVVSVADTSDPPPAEEVPDSLAFDIASLAPLSPPQRRPIESPQPSQRTRARPDPAGLPPRRRRVDAGPDDLFDATPPPRHPRPQQCLLLQVRPSDFRRGRGCSIPISEDGDREQSQEGTATPQRPAEPRPRTLTQMPLAKPQGGEHARRGPPSRSRTPGEPQPSTESSEVLMGSGKDAPAAPAAADRAGQQPAEGPTVRDMLSVSVSPPPQSIRGSPGRVQFSSPPSPPEEPGPETPASPLRHPCASDTSGQCPAEAAHEYPAEAAPGASLEVAGAVAEDLWRAGMTQPPGCDPPSPLCHDVARRLLSMDSQSSSEDGGAEMRAVEDLARAAPAGGVVSGPVDFVDAETRQKSVVVSRVSPQLGESDVLSAVAGRLSPAEAPVYARLATKNEIGGAVYLLMFQSAEAAEQAVKLSEAISDESGRSWLIQHKAGPFLLDVEGLAVQAPNALASEAAVDALDATDDPAEAPFFSEVPFDQVSAAPAEVSRISEWWKELKDGADAEAAASVADAPSVEPASQTPTGDDDGFRDSGSILAVALEAPDESARDLASRCPIPDFDSPVRHPLGHPENPIRSDGCFDAGALLREAYSQLIP